MTEANSDDLPSKTRLRKIIPLPKWSWATIIPLGALVVGILVYRQGQRDFELRSASPIFRTTSVYRDGERRGLVEARAEVVQEFFETLTRLSDESPSSSYDDLLQQILPLSRELSPAPITIDVEIANIGSKTATDVIVSVSWLGEIIEIDDDAISEVNIIDGGISDTQVIMQIDRMLVDETVRIAVEYAAYSQAEDRLILDMAAPYNSGTAIFAYGPLSPSSDLSFPAFRIEVDPTTVNYGAIRVRIGSEQTALENIEVKPLFSRFLELYTTPFGILFPTPSD